ncbi:PREDICTED: heparan-alpha-glucosaminide N-acetyltransferase-like isoform X2 [Camelina sativa]|uniref:Heparan-alpha-glucosaminide N-acetyltransferase-like isoform X2 n=1 Tax=Camelina sativa TaxID=90675 RepID=A0ABM1R9S0_CAMSA|nr:PREDICTED: heparan-alpha-glucosaminide N-acetyltransferase-like isoform X2 [Camelina sativa]
MRTKLTMYEAIKGIDDDDHQWREKKDIESALQISRSSFPPDKERLVSLDVFRGLTVALMILVDDAGGIVPAINHSPWDGLTLADFVMPFFLFIVGVSLAFAYKNLSCRFAATRKALMRSLKLLLLGLFLQGLFGLCFQRIAIAYLVAALCEIWLKGSHNVSSELSMIKKYRFHWVVAFVITTIYLSLLYGLYVPDWEYQISREDQGSSTFLNLKVKCGVRGHTGPGCNAVGMIDRMFLGIQHLYRKPVYARTKQCSVNSPNNGPLPPGAPSWCQAPFDPEGLLCSLMATVTCLVGLHYGHIIIHFKDHKKRLNQWILRSFCLLMFGLALDLFGMHLNKPLYTLSYMCVTSGASGFLLSAIYLMVDVYGYKRASLVLEWMGVHALPIFVLIACNLVFLIIHGFYWKKPMNNLLHLIGIGK